MRFFPHRNLTLVSPLKPDEAVQALAAAIENRTSWKNKLMSTGSGKFCGEVKENSFFIFRDIKYNNMYQPRVSGTISPGLNSRIEVAMKLKPATAIFLGVWIAAIGFTALNALAALAMSSGKPSYAFVGMAGIFAAAAYGRVMFGFGPEARKAEEFLRDTLKAEPESRADLSRQAV
jgi:hypothetical protein